MLVDISGLALFILGAGYYLKFGSSVKATTLFINIGAVVFEIIFNGIMASIRHLPTDTIISLEKVIVWTTQFVLVFVVFRFAERYEESIVVTWVVLFLGAFTTYITVPNLVTIFLPGML